MPNADRTTETEAKKKTERSPGKNVFEIVDININPMFVSRPFIIISEIYFPPPMYIEKYMLMFSICEELKTRTMTVVKAFI